MISQLSRLYTYVAKNWAKYYNFKQNVEHNRLEKELLERNIGEKSKTGSSLVTV